MNGRGIAVLLACTLTGCAGTPAPDHKVQTFIQDGKFVRFDPVNDPYWMDPPWVVSLFKAIQSAIHDPADPADMSAPKLHGAVKFTYAAGIIEYPDIIQSTGSPEMDRLMLRQVASVKPPEATGPRADEPHEFAMEFDMPTPFEDFQSSIYAAIDMQKVYPKAAIMGSDVGDATVDFDYLDGKASHITLTQTSKNRDLDKTSLSAVTQAVMPSALAPYAGKELHMQVVFCYSLEMSPSNVKNICPTGSNVILVTGFLIRRTGA